jgi:hypothetical protein
VTAIGIVLVALAVVIGPGGVVAGAEYPLGIGPWSSTGRYCHAIDGVAQFGDRWMNADQMTLTQAQRATWLALEATLRGTGPIVPRTDFAAWYRTTGDVAKTVTSESTQIDIWWNQNCTDSMMETPASVGHVWSGLGSHARFTHYPKNVLHAEDFATLIR